MTHERSRQDPPQDEDRQSYPATRPTRAVVSVAFSRADFDAIADDAERNGLRISEYIREAALRELRGPVPGASVGG